MKKILGIIQPFDVKQSFYIYEDKQQVKQEKIEIDEIPNIVLSWSNEYNIKDVELLGSKPYNKKIKENIQTAELSKYNKNNLKINLI